MGQASALPLLPIWTCESSDQTVAIYIDGIVTHRDAGHDSGTAIVRLTRWNNFDVRLSAGFQDDSFFIREINFVLLPSTANGRLYFQGKVPYSLDQLSYNCVKNVH
jgi:hypothetical protein